MPDSLTRKCSRMFQLRREICRTRANCPTTFISPFQIYSSCKTYISLPEYSQSRKTKMHPPPHSLWVIWPSLKPSPSSSSFARTQLTLFCSTLCPAIAKRLSASIAYITGPFNSLSHWLQNNNTALPIYEIRKQGEMWIGPTSGIPKLPADGSYQEREIRPRGLFCEFNVQVEKRGRDRDARTKISLIRGKERYFEAADVSSEHTEGALRRIRMDWWVWHSCCVRVESNEK